MSDQVFVWGLALHAYHGVMPYEGKVGQSFTIDMVLEIDLSAAAKSDKVADTVSYDQVVATATEAFKGQRFKLIEAAISEPVQTRLMQAPYLVVPTNTRVKMTGEIARVLAKDTDDLKKKFVFQDWKAINAQRPAWIERFNREIKL